MAGTSIRAHLLLDTKQWTPGLARAGKSFGALTNNVSGMSTKLLAGVAALGIASGKYVAEMDTELRRSAAILDKRSEGFLKTLTDRSREFSVTWGVGLKGVVDATYQMFSLGKSFDNYGETMTSAIKLTKAYGGELLHNTNLLLKLERVLGLTSTQIADMSGVTIQLGDTKLPLMAQYFGDVMDLVANLDMPAEQLFSSFAFLTGRQKNTQKVTTGLKALLSQLNRPQTELSKEVS